MYIGYIKKYIERSESETEEDMPLSEMAKKSTETLTLKQNFQEAIGSVTTTPIFY